MKTEHTPTWTIKKSSTRHPDIFEYTILEPNPDAGKEGVCYAGKYFAICTLDDQDAANRIVLAVNNFEKMREALKTCANKLHQKHWSDCDYEFDGPEAKNMCVACAVLSAIEQEQNR